MGRAEWRVQAFCPQDKTLAEGRLCRPEHFNPYGSPAKWNILWVLFHDHHHRYSGRKLRFYRKFSWRAPTPGARFFALHPARQAAFQEKFTQFEKNS